MSGKAENQNVSIMSRSYNFGLGVNDNGNVQAITNCRDTNRTQNFTYDALNRIATGYTSGANWGEDFTMDAWGNLTNRSLHPGKTNYELLNAPAALNNQLTGFGYDADGNMTQNGTATYSYDGENRLTATAGVTYAYDGDGERVKKSSGTLYWGAGPLAETDLSGNNLAEYIFFDGKRVARRDSNGNVFYYFADHLGSASVISSSTGSIQSESDYYPYGGEIVVTSGTGNHYKFTGKERDSESGLDNFGARYDASALGRFMTPDWAAKPITVPYASFGDPQTLNLYSYVENAPINKIDPDGHLLTNPSGGLTPGGRLDESLQGTNSSAEAGSLIALYASVSPAPDPAPNPQQAQNDGEISLTLGDTKVTGEYQFGWTGDTGPHDSPMHGAVIDATAQNCASCAWVQTVSQTGSFATKQTTDAVGSTTNPLYPKNFDANAAHFYDKPSREQPNAGASTFVATLGTADAKNQTFHAKGAMAYGYSVDKNGKVTGSAPRVATKRELRQALAVVRREYPAWKIN